MASGTLVDRYTGVDRYAVCDSTCTHETYLTLDTGEE